MVALYVDESSVLQTVAFQSRKMRRLFDAFPEVLLVDTTFGTNTNRYKLFSFVVHDINGNVRGYCVSVWFVPLKEHNFLCAAYRVSTCNTRL